MSRIFLILLIISLLVGISLTLPGVQTYIAKRFTKQLNEDYGVDMRVDKVQITLTGKIILKDFIAKDDHKDTIFYGKRLYTYVRNPWNVKKKGVLKLGKTHIDALKGKIIYYKGVHKSNLDAFIEKLDGKSTGKKNNKPFEIDIEQIALTNSDFKYIDNNSTHPLVFGLLHLHASVNDFVQKGSLISLEIEKMQFLESRGIQVQNLTTKFSYDKPQISINNFKLDTDDSSLDMNLVMQSNHGKYGDFNNKVRLSGNIEEAYISTNDLSKLTDVFAKGHHFSIATRIDGTLNNLILKNFESLTDNKIELDAYLKLHKIFEVAHLEINSDIKKMSFSFAKLQQLMPHLIKDNIPENLYELGQTKLTGKLIYSPDYLVTKINTLSNLGKADIDLKMHGLGDITKTTYEGRVVTDNYLIDKILHQNLDVLTTDMKFKGKGLTLGSLNSKFIGVIKKISFQGYEYQNITLNGDFQKKRFNGIFEIADDNLEMDFSGLLDFSHKKTKVDFYSEVCKANLYQLNLVKDDDMARFQGDLQVKAEGNNLDDFVGNIRLGNVHYQNSFGDHQFDDLTITAGFEDQMRYLNFDSKDMVQGYIKGQFKFENIKMMFKNAFGSVFANYKVKPLDEKQYINYKIKIDNKLANLLVPDLSIAQNTYIKGKITSNDNKFKMRLLSDSIVYDHNKLQNIRMRIDNKNPLYNIFLQIDSVKTSGYLFNNIRLLNTTINDTLYLKTKFTGGESTRDKYNLSFYYTMDKNQNFVFGIQKSSLLFRDIPWKINPDENFNRIYYDTHIDSLYINDVGLRHNEEQVHLIGYKTKHKLNFDVNLDSISLSHITPELTDFDFKGKLNGNVHLTKYKKEILPSALVYINDFTFNDVLLGDTRLKINTLSGNNVFVDMSITKDKIQQLKLIGYVDLKKKHPDINASLLVQEFPVTPLRPLFKDIFDDVRGDLTGNVQIKGPLNNASFDGKLYMNKFGLKVKALNVDYQFVDRSILFLHDQTFELKKAQFSDIKHHSKASISGVVKHHNFDNWFLDLGIATDNMLVLDTPPDNEELYYGTVFVGGTTRIYGYVNKLKIDADMQTKPQTRLVITLSDVENVGENDFVRIISKKDYLAEKSGKIRKHKIYEGLEMNFDLDITTDAEVEILLDQEFGSTLVAKGEGIMLLQINTNGKFDILGDFTVKEGIYNFRYFGLIDKKFNVEPGSYISWEGDPYTATMDIKAMYNTFADPSVLLANQGVTSKKMPVVAIIYLKDKLIHPVISFDLELPKANSVVKSQIEYALSDTDKKTLQVLSLLSFGNFVNENDYNLNKQVTSGAVQTVSETGLSLLNSLMSQDDDFQVNLNYTGGENNVQNNIVTDPQVGLSLVTKINKRVYINGKVAIPVGRYTRSSIVGDVEMEVYLDKKGNLIFRVFNKQTELEYLGQQEGYTQGVGVSYKVDFDNFKEILQKIGISVESD